MTHPLFRQRSLFFKRVALSNGSLGDILLQWLSLAGATLLVVPLVHELGHFLVARRYGVRVLSFSIGLGPEIIGFTDAFGTHWRLAALPLGGSVGMRGRGASGEPIIRPTGISDAFFDKPAGQRAAIYLAGPAFSLVPTLVLVVGIILLQGEGALYETVTLDSNPAFILMLSGILISAFDLLPVPPLDGGKLVILGIEALRGKPIADGVQSTLSFLGSIILFLLTLFFIIVCTNRIIWA